VNPAETAGKEPVRVSIPTTRAGYVGPGEGPAELEVEERTPARSGIRVDGRGSERSRSRRRRPPGGRRGTRSRSAPGRSAPEAERGEAVEVGAGPGVRGGDERVPLGQPRDTRCENRERAPREPAGSSRREAFGRHSPRLPTPPDAPDRRLSRPPSRGAQLDDVPHEGVGAKPAGAPGISKVFEGFDEGRIGVVALVEPEVPRLERQGDVERVVDRAGPRSSRGRRGRARRPRLVPLESSESSRSPCTYSETRPRGRQAVERRERPRRPCSRTP